MENLKTYLFDLIANEDLDFIDDSWMDTKFRWLAGNKPSMVEDVDYNEFVEIVNEIKEECACEE